LKISDEVIKASTPLGAGLGFSKNMCGCLTGGVLALGLKYGRRDLKKSRRPSWSRSYRLVERFQNRYHTVSCSEMIKEFRDFSSTSRIQRCMDIIAFTTREIASLLFDPDESFSDPEKESYFGRREFRDTSELFQKMDAQTSGKRISN